jgi:hypothetical protein
MNDPLKQPPSGYRTGIPTCSAILQKRLRLGFNPEQGQGHDRVNRCAIAYFILDFWPE